MRKVVLNQPIVLALLATLALTANGCGNSSTTEGGNAAGGTTSTGGSSGNPSSSLNFSFFVTSQARLFALAQAFNGSTKGFGGDLRYGQTAQGPAFVAQMAFAPQLPRRVLLATARLGERF